MLRACLCLAAIAGLASGQEPKRPKIIGVAHAAFYVSDVDKARVFYKDLLGYEEPFSLKNPDGSLSLTFIKINDKQYIELFPEKEPKTDRLNHISVETDDAEGMRAYLAAKGFKTPAKVSKGRIGNLNFNVTDPGGPYGRDRAIYPRRVEHARRREVPVRQADLSANDSCRHHRQFARA